MKSELVVYLGHLAYLLIFFSFLVRRLIWLRVLAIVAGVASIAYTYNIASEPIWVPIQWNLLFITTNLVHIILILRDKAQVTFTGIIKEIYESKFQNFTPMEFKKLLNIGYIRKEPARKVIIKAHDKLGAIFLILDGHCSVCVNGVEVATLERGDFIGEMSYLTDSDSTADVIATTDLRYIYWNDEKLTAFLSKNANLLHRFQGAIGKQLIRAIIKQNELKEQVTKKAA